jgi:hypothetical protein
VRRLSNNRELLEADPGEEITIAVQAVRTPYQATFSDLESGGHWNIVQDPSPENPKEVRKFLMSAGAREFFVLVFGFPPPQQADLAAVYLVKITGKDGTSDGPRKFRAPAAGNLLDIPYEFRRTGVSPLDVVSPQLAAAVRDRGGE